MRSIKEHFDNDDLRDYLIANTVDEGVIGDFFKKTWNYLKGKIAKIGNYFVGIFNDKVLPVVLPITSQKALLDGEIPDSKGIHWVGTKEDKKYSGVDTTGKTVLNSRESTMEMWKRTARAFLKEDKEDTRSLEEIINEVKLEADDKELVNVDGDALKQIIRTTIKNGANAVPLLIWGAPGTGKTSVVNAVLKEVQGEDARLLDMQLSMKDRDDFFLPYYNAEHTESVDLPKSYLPVWEDRSDMTDEERKAADAKCGKGLLFLDEISRAKPAVQNICLKFVDERKLGDTYKLGSGWSIILASNRLEDDESSQFEVSTALVNRLRQVNFTPSFKSWRKWADTKGYMNQVVLDWLENNQKYLYFQANPETTLYCTPRAWELACKVLSDYAYTATEEGYNLFDIDDSLIEAGVAQAVGRTAASAFMEYIKLARKIDVDKLRLVLTDPKKAPKPKKEGSGYKLDLVYIITSMILSFLDPKRDLDPQTFENICTYFADLGDMNAAAKIFSGLNRMFPNMANGYGDDSSDEDNHDDRYVKGVQILAKAFPEWESAEFPDVNKF